jgi:hypothetical protein
MEEDDPSPKEKDPFAPLDAAALPHLCTFLGKLLSGPSSPEELGQLAATLR